jgi:exodeoxyribonuclease VII large subunit
MPPGPSTICRGIPLSRLLNGVSAAVAQAFAGGVWTLVEVSEATIRNGHVYLDLSERDSSGQLVAKARATIWASTAARLLPEFERATGAVIAAGLKLLVRARPVFKSQYGLSLEIDAIDAGYTLGDLEARKKEIRTRLQQEGVFEHNRRLPPPWDYRLVLVVAPQDAAGLGDFRKEAERLSSFGVCRFVYAHSRFQGEGAAREIVAAARSALAELTSGSQAQAITTLTGSAAAAVPTGPDAVVIIRGGGAVNDLAWLDDYELARFICDQAIPVLTGIGHARDSTLADEVAHLRFDTPARSSAALNSTFYAVSRKPVRRGRPSLPPAPASPASFKAPSNAKKHKSAPRLVTTLRVLGGTVKLPFTQCR